MHRKGQSTKIPAHAAPIRSVSFSRDGKDIVTASDDKAVKVTNNIKRLTVGIFNSRIEISILAEWPHKLG